MAQSSRSMALSKDYGQTKTSLPNLPEIGSDLHDACVVSVNKSTIFLAGGYSQSEQIVNTFSSQLLEKGHRTENSYKLVDNEGLDGLDYRSG